MKKALLALSIGGVSFLVGLLGFVFVLPSVAPGRAEEARLYLDSLEAVRTGYVAVDSASYTSTVHAEGEIGGSADTLLMEPDKAETPQLMSAASTSREHTALKDSLVSLSRRIQTLQAENRTLQRALDEARRSAPAKPSPGVDVAGLTETLSKLDDKELRPILQQLESDILEQLYMNTSGRTQARLLQAMPADRAAVFVQSLVRGKRESSAGSQEPGSTPLAKSAQ